MTRDFLNKFGALHIGTYHRNPVTGASGGVCIELWCGIKKLCLFWN